MDEIFIKDIEVFAYHGVYDFEKKDGQKFFVSAKIMVEELTKDDNLDNTINYGEVATDIYKFVGETQFDLIESVAHGVASMLLQKYELAKEVEITIRKPNAPIPLTFEDVMVTVKAKKHIAFIGLGSNLGDKKAYLDEAVKSFNNEQDITLKRTSAYIATKPYGVTDQDDFLNAVIMIETTKSPYELLDFAQGLESNAKRVRTRRWGERTLDVDILLYDDLVIYDERLTLPHIEMHLREFVLEPLVEIAAGVVHPVLHKTAYTMLKELKNETVDY